MPRHDDDRAIPRCAIFYWSVAAVIGWLMTWMAGAFGYELVGSLIPLR